MLRIAHSREVGRLETGVASTAVGVAPTVMEEAGMETEEAVTAVVARETEVGGRAVGKEMEVGAMETVAA